MAKRIGSLIVFKPGVTKERAAEALKALDDLLEFPEMTHRYEPTEIRGRRSMKYVATPFKHEDAVHEYEEEHGSPVWYIP